MGSQIFVVLEIIFFPKPGIFCTGWLFALCPKTKWMKKSRKFILFSPKYIFVIPPYAKVQNNKVLPSIESTFLKKNNFYLIFWSKNRKIWPLWHRPRPIICWTWKKLCLKLVPKSMIFIWFFGGINKITYQNMSNMPLKEMNVPQTGPFIPLGTGKMAYFGRFWAEKRPKNEKLTFLMTFFVLLH